MQTIYETVPKGTIEDLFSRMQKIEEILAKESKEDESELITRKEACEILNVTDVTIWKWAKQGKIKTYKIGNRIYLFRDEILELVKSGITKK